MLDTEGLDIVAPLVLAAYTCGIDELIALFLVMERKKHRVCGGAGGGAGGNTLLIQKGIGESRLAAVGASDEGKRDGSRGRIRGGGCGREGVSGCACVVCLW